MENQKTGGEAAPSVRAGAKGHGGTVVLRETVIAYSHLLSPA